MQTYNFGGYAGLSKDEFLPINLSAYEAKKMDDKLSNTKGFTIYLKDYSSSFSPNDKFSNFKIQYCASDMSVHMIYKCIVNTFYMYRKDNELNNNPFENLVLHGFNYDPQTGSVYPITSS